MSNILLVSDIHGNLAALDAVLQDAEQRGVIDHVWSLGDTVGYGPQPSECLLRLKSLGALAVAGNHELAALGVISTEDFNPAAKAAAEWTASVPTPDASEYASGLPYTLVSGDFTLVHGSPRDPIWEYLSDEALAAQNLPYLKTSHCVFGHTHVPRSLLVGPGNLSGLPRFDDVVALVAGNWFINPGSVGQPRDGDPRASYAILDDESMIIRFHRVEYPIAVTQALMQKAGLPTVLWQRLEYGF